MHDADAIWAINHEQLVTATDRLLARGEVARRASVPSLAQGARVAVHTPPLGTPIARGTGTSSLVRGGHPRLIKRQVSAVGLIASSVQRPVAASAVASSVQRQVAPAGAGPAGGRGFAPAQLALGSSPGFALPSLAHAPLGHSRLARRSSAELYYAPAQARTTRAYASPVPSPQTRASAEQTLFVRAVRPRPFPVTIVIPMLLGIVAGLAAML